MVCVCTVDAPSISMDPVDQFVVEGDDVTFTVVGEGFEVTFQWRVNGTNLTESPPRITGTTSNQLNISNVTASDFGMYSCVVSSVVASRTSDSATLGPCEHTPTQPHPPLTPLPCPALPSVVVVPVMLEEVTGNLGVEAGSAVNLRCSGSSIDGKVMVEWNTSLPVTLPTPTITTVNTTVTSTIMLEDVSDADAGTYVCTISNRVSSRNYSVELSVVSESLSLS